MNNSTAQSSLWRRTLFRSYYTLTGRKRVMEDRDRFDALYYSEASQIDEYARGQLAELLQVAAHYVPFYRSRLAGKTITSETAPGLLQTLPIITKQLIRAEGRDLESTRPGDGVFTNTSGGSTGEPIRLLQDRRMGKLSRSFELLFMKWAAHHPGEPHVLVWGVPAETMDHGVTFHERVFRFFHNETYLNCYRISDGLLDDWITRINRIKPTLIEGYVDAIHELSQRIITTGRSVHCPSGIITSAGKLTPELKYKVQQAFNCNVVNRYGSREVSNLACSCGQSDSLHVNQAMAWIEIVDDQGQPCAPGIEGDVLVSLFTNHTMPLIRYRIEDRAIWNHDRTCVCGRRTLKLAQVSGRRTDYLMGHGGVRVSGIALTTLLYPVQGIRQYQFRQSAADHVTLAVVPAENVSEPTLRQSITPFIAKLQTTMQGTKIDLRFESDIAPSRSGKYRYVLNTMGDQPVPAAIR